jgi:hypothetical protein
MAHRLFIVARGHDRLYQDLREQFAANAEVEVVVDRRHAERRQKQSPPDTERRGSDRRDRGPGSHVASVGAVPGLPLLIVELARDSSASAPLTQH